MQSPQESLLPEFPGYSQAERDIFEYFDGAERVAGDPIAIRRRLETHLGNVDKVLGACHSADYPGSGETPVDWVAADPAIMAAAQARGQLVEAARDAFRMAPFDPATGQGALEQQVLDAFCAYEEYLKKKRSQYADWVDLGCPWHGEKLPWQAIVGKWLNQDRTEAKFSNSVARGVAMVLGGQPDPEFLRALAKDEREADELAFEARKRKREAEAEAKYGF